MKAKLIRTNGLLLSLCAAFAVSCSKGEEKEKDSKLDPPTDNLGSSEVTVERTQAFGFVSRLPADTEAVVGARHLDGLIDGFLKSNFFKRVTALAGGAIDPAMVAEGQQMISNYIGKDVFLAFAKGSAKELDALMVILDAYNRFSYSMIMKGLMGGGAGLQALAGADDPAEMIKKALMADDQKLLAALENLNIPPIIVGARVTDGAQAVLDQLGALEGQLPPMFVAADFEVEGGKFRSWSVAAKEALGEAERAAMRDEIGDPQLSARLEKLIDGKTVDFSFGLVGDYLIFSIGPNHDHVKLASKPEESLLAAKEFGFADAYLSKKIVAYSYATEATYAAVNRPESILAITDAVQDGLASMAQNGLDFGEVSGLVGKAGKLLVDMSRREASSSLGIMYMEDGLRGESIGGLSTPGLDSSQKLVFADAIPDNAFFAFDMISTAKYEKQSLELLETLAQGAHAAAAKFAAMDGNEGFGEQFNMIDGMFRPKLLKIYDIMKNQVQAGLGRESGIVVDLEGKIPKLPIPVPQAIINEGRMPRIAMFNTVEDRAKLAKAWEELVPALNDLFKSIPGQEAGAEFQLPDTMAADAGDLKTHFIGMLALSPDVTPSVSLSDEVFFLSSAKSLSESIAAKAKQGSKTGLVFRLNFDALRVFGQDWLKLVVANADEIFGGDQFRADDFRENAGMIQMGLEMMQAVNSLDVHNFKEGAHWRTSFHLKISDVPAGAN